MPARMSSGTGCVVPNPGRRPGHRVGTRPFWRILRTVVPCQCRAISGASWGKDSTGWRARARLRSAVQQPAIGLGSTAADGCRNRGLIVLCRLCPSMSLFILAAGNPHEYRGACEGRPSQKQRTESTERGKTAEIRSFVLLPPFAEIREPAPALARRADEKKARATSGLGFLVVESPRLSN